MARAKNAAPTEAQEQEALFQWASYNQRKYPELELMFHIPNEGKRTGLNGWYLKRQGMKAGVPDICLPVPAHGRCALYIEMKRRDGGRLSDAQHGWIQALNRAGNLAIVCHGWEEARDAIMNYLRK